MAIYDQLHEKAFSVDNELVKGVSFYKSGNSTYIKIVNVPQINVMGAYLALTKLADYIK